MSKKSIKGTVGEHKIIIQLLEEGYHVAKAVDPHCPFDLVAVTMGAIIDFLIFFEEQYMHSKSLFLFSFSNSLEFENQLSNSWSLSHLRLYLII